MICVFEKVGIVYMLLVVGFDHFILQRKLVANFQCNTLPQQIFYGSLKLFLILFHSLFHNIEDIRLLPAGDFWHINLCTCFKVLRHPSIVSKNEIEASVLHICFVLDLSLILTLCCVRDY